METLEKLDTIVKKSASKLPAARLRLLRSSIDEASIERNRFENFLKKAEAKPIPKLKLDPNRKAVPPSLIKSPNVKLDFRKKKQDKAEEKVLVPTRRQDENQARKSSYNSIGLLPTKSIQLTDTLKSHQPLSGRLPSHSSNQNADIFKRFSMNSKEIFESVKSTVKPTLKNLDLMNGLDFVANNKTKRTRRDKSIQKIYGVKLRSVSMGTTDRTEQFNPLLSSHKKSRAAADPNRKASKSTQNLRQYRSS